MVCGYVGMWICGYALDWGPFGGELLGGDVCLPTLSRGSRLYHSHVAVSFVVFGGKALVVVVSKRNQKEARHFNGVPSWRRQTNPQTPRLVMVSFFGPRHVLPGPKQTRRLAGHL